MHAPAEPPAPDSADVLDAADAGDRAIAGSAWRIASYVAGSALAIGSTAVVSRHLGSSEFGGYATVLSLSAVALLVTDFGLAALGVREYVTRRGAERDHAMRVLIGLRMSLMCLGTLGMLVFATVAGFSRELWLGTLLAGIGLITQAIPATYAVPLHATLRLGWVGGLDLVRQATQAVALVVLSAVGAGAALLLGAAIPAGLAALVVGAWVARGLAPLLPSLDWTEMRRLARLAVSYAVATSIGAIYAYAGQVVVDQVVSKDESGQFALSFRVFSVVIAVAIIAVGSAYPILARAAGSDQTRFAYVGSRLYEALLLLGVAVGLSLGLAAPAVVEVLGGGQYADAVDVLRLHAVAVVGSFTVAVGSFLLLSQQWFRRLLVVNVGALTASLVLTGVLAAEWGGEGGALAMAIVELGLATTFLVVLRRGGQPVGVRWRRAAGIAAAAVLVLIPAVAIERMADGAVVAALLGILGPVGFLALATAFRAVPDEVVQLVRARIAARG